MTVNVPMIEIGIAIAGISVARKLPRNTKITKITSTKATSSEITTSWIESSMKIDES